MPTTYEPTHLTLHSIDGYRPIPGRCLLQLHRHESLSPGGLIVPESARDLQIDNKSAFATVLKMSPRRGWSVYEEGFTVGDTVVVMLRLEDLSRKDGILVTDNTRVYAVMEP